MLSLVSAACMSSTAIAMFEDQAGAFDWYKQQVGLVERAAFHSVKPRVCVSTQQSVVGCLNLRDGSPVWRKLADTAASAFTSIDYHNVVVTVSGGVVRAFDFEGFLKWEQRLGKADGATLEGSSFALALPQTESSGRTYVPTLVYSKGYIKVRLRRGKPVEVVIASCAASMLEMQQRGVPALSARRLP